MGAPADLVTRFLAKLIDSILLGIVYSVIVVTVLLGAIFGAAGGFGSFGGSSFVASLVGAVITAAIFVGYYAFLESSRGQTLGKMLVKIKVIGPNGGNPTMEQALRRNAYFALSLIGIIPFLGFLAWLAQVAAMIYIAVTINNDTVNRRGWHDEFAGGTKVIKVG